MKKNKTLTHKFFSKIIDVHFKDDKYETRIERLQAAKNGIIDNFKRAKTPVYKEVQRIIDKKIKGINVTCFKDRSIDFQVYSYPFMRSKQQVQSSVLNPLKGALHQLALVKELGELGKSVKIKKVEKDVIHYSSPKDVKIVYWETVGFHNVLTPREEIVLALTEIDKWRNPELIKGLLKLEVIAKASSPFIVNRVLAPILGIFFIYLSKRLVKAEEKHIVEAGYGKDLISVIKKIGYGKIIGAGKMRRFFSILGAYLNMIADIISPLGLLTPQGTVNQQIERVRKLMGNKKFKKTTVSMIKMIKKELT